MDVCADGFDDLERWLCVCMMHHHDSMHMLTGSGPVCRSIHDAVFLDQQSKAAIAKVNSRTAAHTHSTIALSAFIPCKNKHTENIAQPSRVHGPAAGDL